MGLTEPALAGAVLAQTLLLDIVLSLDSVITAVGMASQRWVLLIAEGFGQHVDEGYVSFAMGFSLGVELLNMRLRKVQKPVHQHAGTEHVVAAEVSRKPGRRASEVARRPKIRHKMWFCDLDVAESETRTGAPVLSVGASLNPSTGDSQWLRREPRRRLLAARAVGAPRSRS
jgi:Integral membrane protein TerC family